MSRQLFHEITEFVTQTKDMPQDIAGISGSHDDMSIFYNSKKSADECCKRILEAFHCQAVVTEQIVGPPRVFVYPEA